MTSRNPALTPDEQAKVGKVAEYSGQTFERARTEVLGYMSMGYTLHDALDLITKSTKERVRSSVVYQVQKITSYRIPQRVLDVAMDLADGDISRLRIDPEDGSITVVNQSRKPGA